MPAKTTGLMTTAFARRSVLFGLLAIILTAMAGAASAQSEHRAQLTVLLVNDIYLMSDQAMPDGKRRGGFARLAAVVKAERAKGGHVLFAHAGDTLSPSLMSGMDQGEHIIALTNMIPPDIFAPGNHEFDFGKDVFLKRMSEARFPLFAANLRMPDGTPVANFKDRQIADYSGVRIGLTGATLDTTASMSSSGDMRFSNTVESMKQQAELLRREGADFIIAVVHAPRDQDIAMYSAGTADLLLTGHDHDLFIGYDGRNAVAESGFDGLYVTAVDLDIIVREANGRREVVWTPQFRVIDTANVTPDPEVAAVVALYESELTREMDVPLGTTRVELDSRNAAVRTRSARIGSLFADAMRIATDADVAVLNGGGIRGGRFYPPGTTITRKDILAELPFGNRTVVVEMSGRDLRRAIENGLSKLPDAEGRFPQVSGIVAIYDATRPVSDRIVSMQVGGAPLDEARRYRVAILDFLARGGDDYTMFQGARRITPDQDAPLLANQVMTYIRRLGDVRTSGDPPLRPR
ncbi:MAG: 5-nucleotidase / UDP-sugar diphosphatase [Variibacter sp.]|nr:5-nucleotidase / UDP-sugar diphosphatase [Variibacter sp.]